MIQYKTAIPCDASLPPTISYPVLICQVCQKEFPKFDQRGFRNPGFTAHQNRCKQRDVIAKTQPNNTSHHLQQSNRQRFILPAPIFSPQHMPFTTEDTNVVPPKEELRKPYHHQLPLLEQQSTISSANIFALNTNIDTTPSFNELATTSSRPNANDTLNQTIFPQPEKSELARHTSTLNMMLLGKNHNGNVERLLASSITSYNNDSCISKTIADNDHSMSTLCFTPMFRENEFLSTTFLECLQQQNRSPTEEPFLLGSFPVIECEYCTPEYGFHQANCLIYASFMNLQQP